MNDPIINPWLIYVCSTATKFAFYTFFGGTALLIVGMLISTDGTIGERDEKAIAKGKMYAIIGAVMIFLGILVPNEETCWRMLVASKVTPATLNLIEENAAYIAEKAMDIITGSVIKIMNNVK